MTRRPPRSTLFPYTTLFRSHQQAPARVVVLRMRAEVLGELVDPLGEQGDLDLGRAGVARSEEHTSELQSRRDLVCRLLLEKKNKQRWRRVTWMANAARSTLK